MSTSKLLAASLLPVLFAPTASGQGVITVLEGTQGEHMTIRTWDESQPGTGSTTFLSDVAILPIEKTQRTTLGDLDGTRSRRVWRHGTHLIETPSGAKLIRYRRNSGAFYGFLLIRPNGEPIVVHEEPANPPGVDPYLPAVGVSPSGDHAAFATLSHLIVARLDGLDYASSGAPAREVPLPFGVGIEEPSLTPGATHVFFVTDDDRIWRCGLADGSPIENLTPPATPADELDDELALSGDGLRIAFLFGPDDLQTLWLADGVAPAAAQLSAPPAKYEEAGYLPDNPEGPELLLNHDGSRLMYVESTIRDEIFVLDTSDVLPTTHITSDANFEPYIGGSILPAFLGTSLFVSIGDPAAHDIFEITTETTVVRNVTLTGPTATPPFDTGTLAPVSGYRTASGELVTVEFGTGTAMRVRHVDPVQGTTWLMQRTLRDLPRIGSSFGAPPRLRIAAADGDLFLDPASGHIALATPPGIELSTEVVAPGGGYSVFTARNATLPNAPQALVLHVFQSALLVLDTAASFDQVTLTEAGGIVIDTTDVRYVGPAGDFVLTNGGTQATILSGASN